MWRVLCGITEDHPRTVMLFLLAVLIMTGAVLLCVFTDIPPGGIAMASFMAFIIAGFGLGISSALS